VGRLLGKGTYYGQYGRVTNQIASYIKFTPNFLEGKI